MTKLNESKMNEQQQRMNKHYEKMHICCRVCNKPLEGLSPHQGCVSMVRWGMGRRNTGKSIRLKSQSLYEQRKRILGD